MNYQTSTQNYCIMCGASCQPVLANLHDDRFGAPGNFDIVKCHSCGLEQTVPQPTDDQLKELYEQFYNFGGETGTSYTKIRGGFFASPLYRLWLKWDGDISFHLRQGTGRLLDIGCNEGRTLSLYARNGFQAEGLELNEVAAAVARQRGFQVYTLPLGEFEPENPYDYVVLSNVLEHAIDPFEMLFHVKRVLQPGGQVWISCPNANSHWRTVFGRHWINWHVPFHLWHFSPQTLKTILNKAQFMIQEISTCTPALWLTQSLCAALGSKANKANRMMRSAPVIAGLMLPIRGLLGPWLNQIDKDMQGDCLIVTGAAQPEVKV